MMQVTLNSVEHPENGQVTVRLPIPGDEYDGQVEALESLGIGDALRQDCHVVKLTSDYGILERLEGQNVNVDELDYLAKRLDSFCAGEDAKFQAMAHKLDFTDIKDFIDLILSRLLYTFSTRIFKRLDSAHPDNAVS